MKKLSKYFSRAFICNSFAQCSTALGAVVGAAGYRCNPVVTNETNCCTGELKAPLTSASATGTHTELLYKFCND